jgi:hypothetical protein
LGSPNKFDPNESALAMNQTIILAAVGGLIYNVLPLLELQKAPKADRPDFKDWLFWLPFFIWPLLAGLLGFAYSSSAQPSSGPAMTPLLALNVGLSAPLILRAMAQANPFQKGTQPVSDPNA